MEREMRKENVGLRALKVGKNNSVCLPREKGIKSNTERGKD